MQQTIWHLGQAAILGIVQGVTEFLPVSSSGHLIIVREFLRLPDAGNGFDAILHLATLAATLIYFRQDWWKMLAGAKTKKDTATGPVPNRRLLGLILVATIPGLIVGYFGNHWVENNFRSLLSVAILLIALGIVYLVFERFIKLPKKSKELTSWDALSVGLTQAITVIPGVSRSGATLLGGMYVGLTREAAARLRVLRADRIFPAHRRRGDNDRADRDRVQRNARCIRRNDDKDRGRSKIKPLTVDRSAAYNPGPAAR